MAFAAVVIYAILWTIFDRSSLDFCMAPSPYLALFMTLFIQTESEHRDAQAIHARGELLRSQVENENQFDPEWMNRSQSE